MVDKALTEKVIEYLALQVQEASVAGELKEAEDKIKKIQSDKEILSELRETNKINIIKAEQASQDATQVALEMHGALNEVRRLSNKADKIKEESELAAREAKVELPFDQALKDAEGLEVEAIAIRDKLSQKLTEITREKSSLEAIGISLPSEKHQATVL